MPITAGLQIILQLYMVQVNTENAEKRASLCRNENITVGHEETHFAETETEINFEKNWHGVGKYAHGGESV